MRKTATSANMLPVQDPKVGGSYHVSWAHPGCIWRLIKLLPEMGKCQLRTPKSKKVIEVWISDLRTRKVEQKINQQL